MITIIVLFLAYVSAQSYNNLQGLEHVVLSSDILTGLDVQEIFDLTYSGRVVCHKGTCYNLADQLDFYELNECDTKGSTEVIRTREEWIESYSNKVTVSMDGGMFSDISGTQSKEYKEYHSTTNEHQSATLNVYIGCNEYELIVRPTTMKITENFRADIFKLSSTFNDSTRDAYFAFLKKYGTVWNYRIKLGGRMNGNSFSEYNYLKTVDEVTVTEQMTASFFAQITHETQYWSKLTKEYNESTHDYAIATFGGEYFDPTETDITKWTESIRFAPVVVFKEVYPIYELFNGIWVYDTSLTPYYPSMKIAVESFLNRTGCIDFNAHNYNPDAVVDDGSCVYAIQYTDEYFVTSKTPDPDTVGVKMIHQNEGFCYLVYTEYCETKCRVEIGTDGFWYVRSKAICTANPDMYCGARCVYINPVIGTENQLSISSDSYLTYVDYNPTPVVLPCSSSSRIEKIMHYSEGFCYIALDDRHGTQCQTRIDEDGYWYASQKIALSGHDCGLDLCNVMCANIKFEYI